MPEAKCGFNSIPGGASGSELLVTYGPSIIVDIGFDPDYRTKPVPLAGITDLAALVDTGATESCIDSLLAAQLNLPIVDKRVICGAGGQHEVNMHLAQIYVPSLHFTVYGSFAAVHLAAGGQPHRALLGRTFLAAMKMSYDGLTGDVTLSIP
jgi:predicted aspartyl protease